MSDRLNKLTESFFQDVWGKRERGLLSTIDWSRPIKDSDVEFLLKQYPFLQIISTDPALPEELSVKLLPAKSGWVIHDYGDVLCASPGELMYGDYRDKKEEDESGGAGSSSLTAGKGTIVNQAFLTAQEMIEIAIERGWPSAEIIDGTHLMQWAAWMAAENHEYSLSGFEPSRADKAKRARIQKFVSEITVGPKPGLGRGR